MFAPLVFLFILGLLVVIHELGHFLAARATGVTIEKFSLGFGPTLLARKKGQTEYSLSLVPLGGYVKLAGDNLQEYKGTPSEYLAQPPGRRFWIIFFGPLLNYCLGFLCFWMIFFSGYPTLTTKVGGLIDGFGAKEAGIMAGDRITAIDGKPVRLWEELQKAIQDKKGDSQAVLSILRDNQELSITVAIKEKELDDLLGQKHSVGLLGVTPGDDFVKVRHGFIPSFSLSLRRTWDLTALTCKALARMVTGKLSVRDSVTGPLGIYYITSQAASQGLIAVMHLIAVLSISLGIFNLLPLPVLDGGHIVLLGIEKIRGRYMSLKAERIVTQVGFTLIISLALLVTYNDLVKLFGARLAAFFR